MKKLTILFLILASLFIFCKKEEEGPPPPVPKNAVDLLPKDNEISGWTKSEAMKFAENYDQLYSIIDGGAEKYVQNNFKEAVFQKYKGMIGNDQVALDLQIFDMRDTVNARNVYHAVANNQEIPWADNHPGVEARIDETGLFSYTIDFWEDKFFVRTVIEQKSSSALDVAKTFAFNVSAAIKE